MKNYNSNNNNNYNYKNSFNSNNNNNNNNSSNNNNNNQNNNIDINQDNYLALRYYQQDLFELDSLLNGYSNISISGGNLNSKDNGGGGGGSGGEEDDEEKVDKILNGLQRQIGYLTCLEFEQQQKNSNQKSQRSIPAILEQNQIQKFINYYSERVQSCLDVIDSKSSGDTIVQLDSNFTDQHIASFLDEFQFKIPPIRPIPTKNINEQFNNNSNNQSLIKLNSNNSNNNNNSNSIINVNYLHNKKESIENKLQQEHQKILDQQLQHQQEIEKYEKLLKDVESEKQKLKQQQQQLQLEKQQFQQKEQQFQQQIQQQQQQQQQNYTKSNKYITVDEEMEDSSKESSFKSAKDQYIENQVNKTNERPSVVQSNLRKNSTNNNSNNSGSSSSGSNISNPTTTRKRKNFEIPVNKGADEIDEQNNSNSKKQQVNSNKSGGSSGKNNTSGKADEVNPNGIDNINGIPLDDERLRNLEPIMLERICNEILDKKDTIKWADIAGLSEAKDQIKEMVVYPIMRPELFRGLRIPPKGLLLFGPPGTGKTMIGKAIASEVSATFFSISASTLTSKWIGEGEKMVRCLFAVARCYLPSVIFIDEIDSLLIQRSDNENEASRRIKTEFLIQWDGVAGNPDDRMLLIGATNRPEELDEAARRRMSKRLYIPLPDFESRFALIKHLLSKERHEIDQDGMKHIANLSEGYSGADMKALCTEAAYQPIRDLGEQIATASLDSIRPIQINDFVLAIKRVKPSVDQKELVSYKEWNDKFGALN